LKSPRNTEYGLEKVDDDGGRRRCRRISLREEVVE